MGSHRVCQASPSNLSSRSRASEMGNTQRLNSLDAIGSIDQRARKLEKNYTSTPRKTWQHVREFWCEACRKNVMRTSFAHLTRDVVKLIQESCPFHVDPSRPYLYHATVAPLVKKRILQSIIFADESTRSDPRHMLRLASDKCMIRQTDQ